MSDSSQSRTSEVSHKKREVQVRGKVTATEGEFSKFYQKRFLPEPAINLVVEETVTETEPSRYANSDMVS